MSHLHTTGHHLRQLLRQLGVNVSLTYHWAPFASTFAPTWCKCLTDTPHRYTTDQHLRRLLRQLWCKCLSNDHQLSRELSRNVENCREMSRNLEKCRETSRNVEKRRETSRTVEKRRELSRNVEKCWEMSRIIEFWSTAYITPYITVTVMSIWLVR